LNPKISHFVELITIIIVKNVMKPYLINNGKAHLGTNQ